jgi:DNA repair photolyase
MDQPTLALGLAPPPGARRALPVLGAPIDAQADIVYLDAAPRSVLNDPAATGMGAWSINPYVGCAFGCAYCYARYAHRYVMERAAATDAETLPPWLAFERRVLVKRDAPALVRDALRGRAARYRRLLAGEEAVVVGTATDPYQPAERRFRVTRGVLEALAEFPGMRVVVITKSPLVARDADVLARIAARARLTVHVSLITLDRALARRVEPRAPTPESRQRAIERLATAGVDVGVNVMPVLPGLTDHPAALERLFARVAAAGATHVAAGALVLRATARDRYLPWIEAEFPALGPRYRATYARSHAAGARYRAGLRACVEELAARHGLGTPRDYEREREERAEREAVTPPPEAAQLALGI